jgi:hypothetical protein
MPEFGGAWTWRLARRRSSHRQSLVALAIAACPTCMILKPKQMHGLLDRYAFKVRSDEDIATLGALLSSDLARATRLMKHLRIVVADRFQNE